MEHLISIADQAPTISTTDVLGEPVALSNSGYTLLSFYRFATCPFCNLRLRQVQALKTEYPRLQCIGVFGSPKNEWHALHYAR